MKGRLILLLVGVLIQDHVALHQALSLLQRIEKQSSLATVG